MWRIDIQALTDPGTVREANEDHILVGDTVRNRGNVRLSVTTDNEKLAIHGMLLGVADGVGGEAGGATASRLSLQTLRQSFSSLNPTLSVGARLKKACESANAKLLEAAQDGPEHANMGTTLSGICLTKQRVYLFHAGDSRIYRYYKGALELLTQDHTVAAEALRRGELTSQAAEESDDWHVLTNCVGNANCEFQIHSGPKYRIGDIWIISTDGLFNVLSADDIVNELNQVEAGKASLAEALTRLKRRVIAGGAHDNLSVVLAHIRRNLA